MITLDRTGKILQILLGAPVVANPLSVVASYYDVNSDLLKWSFEGSIGVTEPIDIAQGDDANKGVTFINVLNEDTANANVILQIRVGDAIYKLITVTLSPSDVLTYTEDGWSVFDKNGAAKNGCCSEPLNNVSNVDPTLTDDITKGYTASAVPGFSEWLNDGDPDANNWNLFVMIRDTSGNALWKSYAFA